MTELDKKKRREDATVASNLTKDIILELLSWLPVKSLLRFRCVCQSWCDLIDHPDFVKLHLTRSIATNNNLSTVSIELKFDDYRSYYGGLKVTSVNLDDFEQRGEEAVGVEFDYPIEITGALNITCCNGLAYMFYHEDGFYTGFLFNPSTRTHRELPDAYVETACQAGYGFGYDPTTDDYKLIGIFMNHDDQYVSHVMVYSLSSNSWRRIEDIPLFDIQYWVGVFTNSAFHWVSRHNVIVAIDIKDDKLREVPLPDLGKDEFYMTIGALGETLQLCMLCNYSEVRIDFWVMKDYGVRDSWEKRFSIQEPSVLGYSKVVPVYYSKKGEALVMINNIQSLEALVLYDPHKGRASHLWDCGESYWIVAAAVCIENLISLDTEYEAHEKKERKKQRLERREKEVGKADLFDPSMKKIGVGPGEGTSQMVQEEGYTADSSALPIFLPQWNLTEKSSIINDPFVSREWATLSQLPVDSKAMAELDDKKFIDSAFCAAAGFLPFFVEAINRASRSSAEASTCLNRITEQHTEIEGLHDSMKKLMGEVDGLKKEKDARVHVENLILKERNEAQSEAQKAKVEIAHARDEATRAWEEVATAREEASKYAKEQANLKRELNLLQLAWENTIEKAKAQAVAEYLESLEFEKLVTSYDVKAFKVGLKGVWMNLLRDYPDLDTSKYTTCCDPAIYDELGMERPSWFPPKAIPKLEVVGKEKGKEEDKVDEVNKGFQDVAKNGVQEEATQEKETNT